MSANRPTASLAVVSRPLTVEDLLRLVTPSDPQLSPDGNRVVFVRSYVDVDADENRSMLAVLDLASGRQRTLTEGPMDANPSWSPDGATLAFTRGESLRLLPFDGGESTELLHARGLGGLTWSPDGERLAYVAVSGPEPDATAPVVVDSVSFKADGAGLLPRARPQLFVVDVAHGGPRQLTDAPAGVGAPVWEPAGRRLAFLAGDDDAVHVADAWVVDADGGAARRVTRGGWSLGTVTWLGAQGRLLLTGAPATPAGQTRLLTVDVDGAVDGDGEPQPLAESFDRSVMTGSPGYPGSKPDFDERSGEVVFSARDRGRVHVFAADLTGGVVRPLLTGEDRVIGGWSRRGSRTAFVAASPDSAGEVWIADADGERRVTTLLADALPDVELIPPMQRHWTAPDGTALEGWLLLPPDSPSGPLPTLLDIHGGPHNAWGPAFDGVHAYHQTLVAAGWAVVYLNPRGSDGYGEDFYTAAVGRWGEADEQDFHACLDDLVAAGVADPGRLAVTGYSYGGFMSCWLSARSDRFAAAVPGGCIANLVSSCGTSDAGSYLADLEFHASPGKDDGRLRDQSPLTYVDAVRTPTLLLHGEDDDRCPVGQAEEWFTALRTRSVTAQLVRYPEASHVFIVLGRPSHRVDYSRRVHDWVVAHAVRGRATPAQVS